MSRRVAAAPVAACADCGAVAVLYGRGLCWGCYECHEQAGDLASYPTTAELGRLDWAFMRLIAGLTVEDAARRLHVTYRGGLALDRDLRARPRMALL